MWSKIFHRLTYANVVGTLALFLALGGTAMAVPKFIAAGDPAGGDLTGTYPDPSLANGSVTTAKFAAGAKAPDANLLDGLDGSAYTLSCPAGTTLFIGVCIENAARDAATQPDATDVCADEGRRLPSGGELQAFREAPGITLASGEWTDDVADITRFSVFAIFVVTETGNGVAEAFDDLAYRCVAGPVG